MLVPGEVNVVSRVGSHPGFPPAFRRPLPLDVLGPASVCFLCDGSRPVPEARGVRRSSQLAACGFNDPGLFDF